MSIRPLQQRYYFEAWRDNIRVAQATIEAPNDSIAGLFFIADHGIGVSSDLLIMFDLLPYGEQN